MTPRRGLGLIVFGAFVWCVQRFWGWQHVFAPWGTVPLTLVALVVSAQMGSYSLRAYRVYRAEMAIPRGSWTDCLRLVLLNNVANLVLPARSGEASFPLLLNRWFGVSIAKGVGTLIWLRLLDLGVLGVLAMAVLGVAVLPNVPVTLLISVCLAGMLAPLLALPFQSHLGRHLAGRAGKFATLQRKLLSGVPSGPRQVLLDIALSWGAWGLKLGALASVFAVLASLPVPEALLGVIGGDLSTVLPLHAPGGFGTYEAGVMALVATAARPDSAVLAAAVNLHLLVLGIALLAGAIAWLTQPDPVPKLELRPERSPNPMSASILSLSVVIPMYCEQDNVKPMLEGVHRGLADYPGPWELIVVDDGSTDETGLRLIAEAQNYGPHVRVLRFARNHGQTAAMQAGIDAARGDVLATLDGDLQNDPAEIPRLVREMIEGDLDLLAGKRTNRQDALFSRKIPSKIANSIIGRVTGVRITDYGCSLKVYRASIIKQVRLYGEMHRFIPVWAAMVTAPHRIAESPVSHSARQFGSSKYGISRTFRVVLDLLTVFFFMRFEARPGHFFGVIGLALGALGGALLSWLGFVKFALGNDIGGRPLLLVAILLLVFSMQFITTGVVAEMLTRIFYQGQPRVAMVDEATLGTTDAGWMDPASPAAARN